MKNLYKHSLSINKAQTMVDITEIVKEDIIMLPKGEKIAKVLEKHGFLG